MIASQMIKDRIRSLGLRQEDVGASIGLKQSTFNQKLNNVRPMLLEEAEKIANVLGITDSEFRAYFFSHDVA